MVNNNAAAVMLMLAALASGGEVIVSRGELIEIGGSFRLPDVMVQSGCRLREVGATNRTHLKDYARAITPETRALMKAWPSNYRITGFQAEVPARELVALGRQHELPVIEDLGSGLLLDLSGVGFPDEPPVRRSVEAGVDPATWEASLEDAAANEDYDILIVGTWQMVEFLQNIAPKYPDKKFMIYDTSVDYETCEMCDHVYSVLYKQNEGSYLAGLYAGLMTQQDMEGMNEEKIIGVIGGQDIPVINDFIVGYKQGAADAGLDPDTGVIVQYAGDWNDPATGKEIALAMYQQGADIVFNVAGGTGVGIFQAAEEVGRYAIGVDSDQATIIAGKARRVVCSDG